ncbi:MAG: 4-(cytidine 5'-diphospho)-2-C-methyl-D-erythritol kinase [Lachnospiraceae bacterium]|nr:4-(cytidine 5'-diphospho)-2-C-methyl-D-erythritol kinase [Lachnospiraceae bacterium]
MITERAYAKINLSLDVTGKRPGGYHDVRMIMQTVDIHDTLTFEKCGEGILLDVGGSPLPDTGDNLIVKAAKAVMEKCGINEGVCISLDKHIPIAAGMAGGSSDAAAALRGVNKLFGCGLSNDELRELGVKIGADVPYCVEGGTVLAEGIGEVLTDLAPLPELVLAVAKPVRGVSTGNIYTALDEIFETISHPDVDAMLEAMKSCREGCPYSYSFLKYLGNVLEYVTIPLCPEINDIKKIFEDGGCAGTLMTGSGPTVFAFFDTESKASSAIEAVRKTGLCAVEETFVTKLISPDYR